MPRDDLDDWIDKACEADPLANDGVGDDAWTVAPRGPPLTPEEIDAAGIRLAKWQSAEFFSKDVMGLCNRCSSSDYFRQPRLNFLQEAFVLAEFATKRRVGQVRLAPPNERWPDGYVKIEDRTFNVEVTSTHGGRKLGDEYRRVEGAQPVVEHDPVEDWVARADSIPKHLDEAISRKASRNYASPCWLVIYLNINEWGIRQEQTKQVIAGAIDRHRDRFENISVLWKGALYSAVIEP
jgi:hypothetical protein